MRAGSSLGIDVSVRVRVRVLKLMPAVTAVSMVVELLTLTVSIIMFKGMFGQKLVLHRRVRHCGSRRMLKRRVQEESAL